MSMAKRARTHLMGLLPDASDAELDDLLALAMAEGDRLAALHTAKVFVVLWEFPQVRARRTGLTGRTASTAMSTPPRTRACVAALASAEHVSVNGGQRDDRQEPEVRGS